MNFRVFFGYNPRHLGGKVRSGYLEHAQGNQMAQARWEKAHVF